MFFSAPVSKELVCHIKNDTSVLPRIGALREVMILLLVIGCSTSIFIASFSFSPGLGG